MLRRSAPRRRRFPARLALGLAIVLIVGLPLHTGVVLVGRALGAPSGALTLFQLWKELAIAVLAAGVLHRIAIGRVRFEWGFVLPGAAWLLFAAYIAYWTALSSFDSAALYGLRVYLEPIVAGLAVGIVLSRVDARRLLPLLLARVGCLIFLLATLQAVLPTNAFVTKVRLATADSFGQLPSAMTVSVVSQFRAFATFADPNDLGFFAAIVFIGTFAPAFQTRVDRLIRAGARFGALLTLGVSYSRSAMLATAVGCATLAASALLFEFARHRERAVRFAILGTGAAVLAVASIGGLATQIPQVQHLSNTFSGADPSARGHVASLVEGGRLLRERPEGVGLGRVGPRSDLYRRGSTRTAHVESSFLQVGLELGIVGLAIYLVAAILTFGAALTRAGAVGLTRHEDRHWGRVICAIITAQLVGYLFLPTIVSLQTGTLVWAYIALLAPVSSRSGSGEPTLDAATALQPAPVT